MHGHDSDTSYNYNIIQNYLKCDVKFYVKAFSTP